MRADDQLVVIRTYGEPVASSYDYMAVKPGPHGFLCPSLYHGDPDMIYKAIRVWMISIINDIEAGD